MLLFAEKLVPYNTAYITLITEDTNLKMQHAATSVGYYYLNWSGEMFLKYVTLIKPISPFLFGDSEIGDSVGAKRKFDIDPFDVSSFQDS